MTPLFRSFHCIAVDSIITPASNNGKKWPAGRRFVCCKYRVAYAAWIRTLNTYFFQSSEMVSFPHRPRFSDGGFDDDNNDEKMHIIHHSARAAQRRRTDPSAQTFGFTGFLPRSVDQPTEPGGRKKNFSGWKKCFTTIRLLKRQGSSADHHFWGIICFRLFDSKNGATKLSDACGLENQRKH